MVHRYKIYYGNGKIIDDNDEISFARDVQVIVQDHPDVGSEIVTGADYYVLDNERWRGVDIFGLFDFLLDSKLVLFGRTLTNDEYREIYKIAAKDKDGWLPFERKVK
jgi:hypothetical protein